MVYAYLRVSTDKQDGINQKQGIEEFCQKRGFVIDEYIEKKDTLSLNFETKKEEK